MGGGDDATVNPFRIELERWKAVAGGIDRDGNVLQPPWELQRARLIDGLCQRYSCLPSQLFKEDMDVIFRTQTILHYAGDGDNDTGNNQQPSKSTAEQLANMSKSL
jgi:hypothetical protein